jgi:hypothetical protein
MSNNVTNVNSSYSNQHNDKFLRGHATKPVISYSSLNNAMRNGSTRTNVGGITRGKGKKYTLRKGTKLEDGKGEQSWVKYKSKSNIKQKWINAMKLVLKNKNKLQKMEHKRSKKFNNPLNKKKSRQRKKQRKGTIWKPNLNSIKENNIYSPKPIKMKRVKKVKKSRNNIRKLWMNASTKILKKTK